MVILMWFLPIINQRNAFIACYFINKYKYDMLKHKRLNICPHFTPPYLNSHALSKP